MPIRRIASQLTGASRSMGERRELGSPDTPAMHFPSIRISKADPWVGNAFPGTRTITPRARLTARDSVGVKTGTSSSSGAPSVRVHLSGFTLVLLQLIDLSEVAMARMSCILLTMMLHHLEFCLHDDRDLDQELGVALCRFLGTPHWRRVREVHCFRQ